MRNSVDWNVVVLPPEKAKKMATASVMRFIVTIFMMRVTYLLSSQGYQRIFDTIIGYFS